MIKIDRDEIISELNLTVFGAQGWMQDKNNPCPFCGGSKKYGIHFDDNGTAFVFHCWKCGIKTNTYNFLKQINRLDLIRLHYENSVKSNFVPLIEESLENEVDEEIKEVVLPKKLERLKDDDYLNKRGFRSYHYDEFEPSVTNFFVEKKFWDYIIFKLKMNNKVVAWLARSRKSKEWHEQNLRQFKQGKSKLQLRYENSKTDFTKILGGYDTITNETNAVIIVEGLFDYIGIDTKLELREDESVRCVFTFGNNISKEQIQLLKKKNIKNVILMYDPDKPKQVKSSAMMLYKFFDTKIALLKDKKKDPGDATVDELLEALTNLIDPINFRALEIFS